MSDARRYSFGPLSDRGIVLGLAPLQVIALVVGASAALVGLWVGGDVGPLVALATLGAAALAAFAPLQRGKTALELAPPLARWLLNPPRPYRSRAPFAGRLQRGNGDAALADARLPSELADLEMLSVPVRGAEIGVICDRPRDTYVGVIVARARSFGLLDVGDQEARLDAWGHAVGAFSTEDSPVRRIGWVERTVPSDGDELAGYLQARRDPAVALDDSTVRSYIDLIEGGGDVTREHEVLVTLQIDGRRGWRAVKRHGGGDAGACALLLEELRELTEQLQRAEVDVEGALRPRQLAAAIRHQFDPFAPQRGRLAKLDPAREGTEPSLMGPRAAEESWAHYRSDSAVHRTYWISSWPRRDVGPAFLQPLLMQAGTLRSVAVAIEPVPPSKALRVAEGETTKEEAELTDKSRKGFRPTARARRRYQSAEAREDELAAGHSQVRFAGFITVSASELDELERACGEVENAARRCALDLEPMYGEQAMGFTFTLPLARGLV